MMASKAAMQSAVKGDKQAASEWDPGELLRIVRETVESVAIAFILAFLFKSFVAEMFVIPTGSMAPTLQGRHKDLRCPQCGFRYRTGASEEVNTETGDLLPKREVRHTICPMCRYEHKINPEDWKDNSYNGDRIVVGKFLYDFDEPKRWDVVVFKYPLGAKINYIKRLIGLPNETVKIEEGNIYVKRNGESSFHIERKPPGKVRATLQDVYDNDYLLDKMIDAGCPPRWLDWSAASAPEAWKNPVDAAGHPDRKMFEFDGKTTGLHWLRYVHTPPGAAVWNRLLPDGETWQALDEEGRRLARKQIPVRDFCAYNAVAHPLDNELSSVTDLALDCQVNYENKQGELVLELVKQGHRCQCQFDLTSGDARLSVSGLDDFSPQAKGVLAPGQHHLLLVNVDSRLLLWVDEQLVSFDSETAYPPLRDTVRGNPAVLGTEKSTDTSPAGVAAQGVAVTLSHLRILRDGFYTTKLQDSPIRTEIEIGPDQFLMLGDNSPQSSDGRVWGTVQRKLLTGKALFVYWPHSFDHTSPDGGVWFPFFPNFSRMGRVK